MGLTPNSREAYGLLLLFAAIANQAIAAVDLTTIDRTIVKLPAFRSSQPEFCLLVFGPEATKRVWLIHDGDTLYVDRNNNGDLTEPGEAVTASGDYGTPGSGRYQFKAGNIWDRQLEHKDLRVYWLNLDHLSDEDSRIKKLLDKNPKWRGCTMTIDVEMPGQKGSGLDGRVPQTAGTQDSRGILQFSPTPETAPIIHFGGPWEITIYSLADWHIGQTERQYLAVGTPGFGPGTSAWVAYEDAIPANINPSLRVRFPAADRSVPFIIKTYQLKRRCCGVNLYGDVQVPDEARPGTAASVQVDLPRWQAAEVASTLHKVKLVPGKLGPKLEPVSWRLKGTLEHSNKGKVEGEDAPVLVGIRFSPDGKQLVAGDYPGGVVNLWDVESKQRLASFETDTGYRSGIEYFRVTPDWKSIYAATNSRGRTRDRVDRNGTIFYRWSFDDLIRVWDLETGNLIKTLQDRPAREMGHLRPSPDGIHFICYEGVPGEYSEEQHGSFTSVKTLWNLDSGEHHSLSGEFSDVVFSADGKRAAVSIRPEGALSSYETGVGIIDDLATGKIRQIVKLGPLTSMTPINFVADGKQLLGVLTTYRDKDDYQNISNSAIKLWDTATGKEICTVTKADRNQTFGSTKISPVERVIATTMNDGDAASHVCCIDSVGISIGKVDLGIDTFSSPLVFDPSGKYIAVATNRIPKSMRRDVSPPTQFPQPQIRIISADTGKLLETLIAPQCIINCVEFSPDGKTLATSGNGEVLLWDFSTPPGQPQPK